MSNFSSLCSVSFVSRTVLPEFGRLIIADMIFAVAVGLSLIRYIFMTDLIFLIVSMVLSLLRCRTLRSYASKLHRLVLEVLRYVRSTGIYFYTLSSSAFFLPRELTVLLPASRNVYVGNVGSWESHCVASFCPALRSSLIYLTIVLSQ